MKYIEIAECKAVSKYVLGCMRMKSLEQKQANKLIKTAIDCGINFFDHADIYGKGTCETMFGNGIKDINRQSIYIQSKCGIDNGTYNNSYNHIISSVECIIKRLKCEYLDFLLIHRPDVYSTPEETAKAFLKLKQCGLVRNFGVSNFNAMQIELLQKYCNMPLAINQMQFSLAFTGLIDEGFNVNNKNQNSIMYDGSCFNYMRLKNITMQAWSPLQYGFFEGVFIDEPKYKILNNKLEEIAEKYQSSKTAIAIAWINSIPYNVQTIIGSTNINRIIDIAKASDIELTREEWYALYKAAGNVLP